MKYLLKITTVMINIIALTHLLSANAGSSGYSFLKLPSSAGSAGVLGVFSQISGQPVAIFENPVGVSNDSPQLTVTRNFWFADVRGDILGFSFPLKGGTLALGLNSWRIPGIELRDIPSEEPLGNIEAQYYSGAVGYSYDLRKRLKIALSGKYLYESLYYNTSGGMTFDSGILWNAPGSLDISFLLQNLGFVSMNKSTGNDPAEIPLLFKIGVVRREIFTEGPLEASIGLTFGSNIVTGETESMVGARLGVFDALTLRGGYAKIGSVIKNSLGFGLNIKQFQLDYAIIFMPEGLGNPNLFTLSFLPGQ